MCCDRAAGVGGPPTATPVIGWVGIGAMGWPMSQRLAAAGLQLTVCDRDPSRQALARALGMALTPSPADAARGADIVFSMVYDDAALTAVVDGLDGSEGLAAAMRPGSLLIDMSTVSPAASARVAERLATAGIAYLRAPVSGSVALAEAGTLTVFASGNRDDFERVAPVLCHIAESRHYVGAAESARVVKLAINLMVATSTALIGEALAFGESQGLARASLVDALNASIVGSRHYQARAAALKSRVYGSSGPVDLVRKDLALVLALAGASGVELPLTARVDDELVRLQAHGDGTTEITVLAEMPGRLSNASGRSRS